MRENVFHLPAFLHVDRTFCSLGQAASTNTIQPSIPRSSSYALLSHLHFLIPAIHKSPIHYLPQHIHPIPARQAPRPSLTSASLSSRSCANEQRHEHLAYKQISDG
jgi:hypothetical protein